MTGWFDAPTVAERVAAINEGAADQPADWPDRAVGAGVADSEADYYAKLHEAAVAATRDAVERAESDDDQQLIHAIRALDDTERTANELAERVTEWAGSLFDSGAGIEGARTVADREPDGPVEQRVVALAERIAELAAERDDLRAFVERRTPEVAPNLSALAGPVLAARLIALAGGLGELAKMPSGTVQVLGAEDALFAHLSGDAPSPKHGIIYVHEYVRGTRPAQRGSAARALAGKLSIAARIDHYAGDRRPEIDAELDGRIDRIRARDDAGQR